MGPKKKKKSKSQLKAKRRRVELDELKYYIGWLAGDCSTPSQTNALSLSVRYLGQPSTNLLGCDIQRLRISGTLSGTGKRAFVVHVRRRGGWSVFLARVYFMVLHAPGKLGLPDIDEAIPLLQLMTSVSVQPCPLPAFHGDVEGIAFSTLAMEKFIKLCAHFEIPRSKVIKHSQVVAAIIAVPKVSGSGAVPQVVAIATGTKMADAKMLISGHGDHLVDYHAEVLAVRAFRRWVFDLLRKFSPGKVQDGILSKHSFHLFVNRPPCGDAALDTSRPDKQAILRCRMEKSQALSPSEVVGTCSDINDVTKGVLQVMTCSDKLAMWSVCGIQGALLSQIVGPVYLRSVTVAEEIDGACSSDALQKRVEEALCPSKRHHPPVVGTLPPLSYEEFKEHQPEIHVVPLYDHKDSADAKPDPVSPNYSINWSEVASGSILHTYFQPTSSVEVVKTDDGIVELYLPKEGARGASQHVTQSTLSKAAFAKAAKEHLLKSTTASSITYRQMKDKAEHYMEVKKRVREYFSKCCLGTWIRHNLDNFVVKT